MKLTNPKNEAAGMKAITESFRHVLRGTNVARGWKALVRLNQKDGYDCPSCAWPDPDHQRSPIAEYCESGAKAVADEVMTRHTAGPALFQRYSVAELQQKDDLWLGQQGRLTQPMVIREGQTHYQTIDWGEAFAIIGQHLTGLSSPNEAVFYTSGRASNESAFLYQLFVRLFGTNNLPDCSNMCHESTTVALTNTIGLGKASVVYDDFEQAEVIIIMGQNPGTNAPRMLTVLEEAKRNGAKIIAINPIFETGLKAFRYPQSPRDMLLGGEKLTDLFLQVGINTDISLLKAMAILLLEAEKQTPGQVLGHDFIAEHTTGYEALVADLTNYDVGELAVQCGLSVAQIQEAVDMIKHKQRIIICWAMGLTQHKNAVATIQEVMNLILLKGAIGKPGAGAAPIRGHSNVQGDRTMGVWEKPKPEFLDKLGEVFGFEPPRQPGLDTVAATQAMHQGRAKVFVGLGGNFVMAVSDTDYTAEALQRCDLTVQISTKLNRSHLIHGKTALILPTLGHSDIDRQATGEQVITMEGTTGVVQQSRGPMEPVSPLMKSEPAIVAGMAKAALGSASVVNWDDLVADYDRIREKISRVVPGFTDFNQKVKQPGGFYLPNGPRNRDFKTTDGKAHFSINALTARKLAKNELLLMTVRSHDQFNTTVYGLDDRYRGIYGERRVVMLHADDMAERGLVTGSVVNLHSYFHGKTRTAIRFIAVPHDLPRGNAAAYFPETNVLVPIDSQADGSHTPTSKSIVITVEIVLDQAGQPVRVAVNKQDF
jgi:molybdopterin-dependent oxidoreductase alpha subunit